MIQIFVPGVLFAVDWNNSDEDVALSARGNGWRIPNRDIPDLPGLDQRAGSRQHYSGRIGLAAQNPLAGVGKSKVLTALLRISGECGTPACFTPVCALDCVRRQIIECRSRKKLGRG